VLLYGLYYEKLLDRLSLTLQACGPMEGPGQAHTDSHKTAPGLPLCALLHISPLYDPQLLTSPIYNEWANFGTYFGKHTKKKKSFTEDQRRLPWHSNWDLMSGLQTLACRPYDKHPKHTVKWKLSSCLQQF
jgi:hypothetical protein